MALVPGPDAQPEVETDAAVNPGDDEYGHLHGAEPGGELPEHELDVEIVDLNVQELVSEAGAEDVLDEERGNGKPEEELCRLPRGHAQRAALIELRQGERYVDEERAVERRGGERQPPKSLEPFEARLLCLERDEPERMI